VVTGLQWDIYLIYLDDVIVFGKSFEDMLKNLFAVFERMHTAGLKLKARTCKLFSTEVEYLGHVVSKHGFATDPKKIDAVKTCLKPSNVSELRSKLFPNTMTSSKYIRYMSHWSPVTTVSISLSNMAGALHKPKDINTKLISSFPGGASSFVPISRMDSHLPITRA
jgi:hypothetical protein